jgi:hypothetical protein
MKKAMNPTVQDKPPKEATAQVESPTSYTRALEGFKYHVIFLL